MHIERNRKSSIKKFSISIIVLLCLVMLSLTGCIRRLNLDDLPSDQKVMEYASKNCPEPITFVESQIDDDRGGIRYYFVTDRGVEFNVHSYISSGFLSSDRAYMKSGYSEAIRNLYKEEVLQVFKNNFSETEVPWDVYNMSIYVTISSYDRLESVSRAIRELEDIWSKELDDVDQSFPLITIKLSYEQAGDDNSDKIRHVNLMDISIDGTNDEEDILNRLQETYLSLYETGEILSAEGIPEDLIDSERIIQRLFPVTINGENYIQGGYDGKETVVYDEERSAYLIRLGFGRKIRAPEPWMILQETAGLKFRTTSEYASRYGLVEDILKNATCEWEVNNTSWKMTLEIENQFLWFKKKSALLERNGIAAEDIELVDMNPDKQDETGLVYAVSLDDFCEMFDLEYTIDKEAGSITFTSVHLPEIKDN